MATKKTEVPAEQEVMTEVPAEQEVMNTAPPQNVDPDVLAALKAEMMAEVRAELKAEMKAEVKAEVAKADEPEEPYHETEEEIARANELVNVRLFKDAGKYKHDVLVIVNGESALIQRGKNVKIRRKFADALAASEMQMAQAADVIEGYEEVYEDKKDALN